MYGGGGAAAAEDERTAFRKAEKRYKLYKSSSSRRPTKHQRDPIRPTDLSDVVDFHAILDLNSRGEDLPPSIEPHHGFPGPPVFRFRDRPGFYFIPRALSIKEQCQWVRESLMNFPQPPNRTNHTAIYGHMHDLFLAAQRQKVLVEVGSEYVFAEDGAVACDRGSFRPVPAGVLLRKLRWSTLGLQFDWSKRNYDVSLPYNKIPDALCYLTKKMAAPAMPQGEEFHPEAAIVNYFGPSDMLGGHLDDMEADWSKPIVSISLGCKAIFLLGGKSREDVPIAMFLRSGDVVLMAGQARECFHGVPRIFTDEENSGSSALISQFSGEVDQAFADYLRNSRININIRQVN